jgi:pilus assembly protein CpaD
VQNRLYPIALLLVLALAACVPGVAEYTKTEASNELRVHGSDSQVTLAFAARSARLSAGQAARLRYLIANGTIRPADRVTIAAAGSPGLAEQRFAAISGELLRAGIVADSRPLAGLPPDRAIVIIGRYAVILPPCPNFSKPSASDFTNEASSNFGCAVNSNLGLMVANPADLDVGRPLGPALGKPNVAAIERYMDNKVTPLITTEVGPIGTGTGGSTGMGAGTAATSP